MLRKKHSKERRIVGAAIITLAASRVVGLFVLGAQALRHLLASRRAVDAAGLSARQRFDLYADLEYAREKEKERARQGRLHFTRAEAT